MSKPGGDSEIRDELPHDLAEAMLFACLELPATCWLQAIEEVCRSFPEHAAAVRRRFAMIENLRLDRLGAPAPVPPATRPGRAGEDGSPGPTSDAQ